MSVSFPIFRSSFVAVAILLLAALLASCAAPPRPMNETLVVTVTEVSVSAASADRAGFAGDLQGTLEAALGRTRRDIGRDARMRLFIRDLSERPGGFAATTDIEIIAADSGRLIYLGRGRNFAANRTSLIAGIVRDMRHLVGLSGEVTLPIEGRKAPVVRPTAKPVVAERPADAAVIADPLLNGTLTPDSPPFAGSDELVREPPVIDTSKPLLAAPAEDADTPAPAADAGIAVPSPANSDAPVEGNEPAAGEEGESESDMPCIVTVDNDCRNPDAN